MLEKKNKKKKPQWLPFKNTFVTYFFFQTLYRSIYSGEAGTVEQLGTPIQGFLDDYAFLIKGLLDLYEATLDSDWISWANELQKKQIELFWDSQNFGFFTAPDTDKSIILRMKEDQDGAEPSGNSVSSLNLLKLGSYTENSEYKGWQKNIEKKSFFYLPHSYNFANRRLTLHSRNMSIFSIEFRIPISMRYKVHFTKPSASIFFFCRYGAKNFLIICRNFGPFSRSPSRND